MRPRIPLLLLALGLVLPVAACGDDDTVSETGTTVAEETTTSAAEEETTTTAGGSDAGTGGLAVGESDLGEIVVDAEGVTLYAFLPDSETTSACTGGCTGTWPPVTADEASSVGGGLDEALLGTLTRDDGSEQASYGGHPLYRFSGDAGPGDTNGQGVGGNWFVVAPDGTLIQ